MREGVVGCAALEVPCGRRSPSRLLARMERSALGSAHHGNSTKLHNHPAPPFAARLANTAQPGDGERGLNTHLIATPQYSRHHS